ncbi:hypothetical protein DFH28DRAFT_1009577 [Melampsora americana]|nr:hypothetical protein DFH28DRAFT_1009577 [Melampsora americana]
MPKTKDPTGARSCEQIHPETNYEPIQKSVIKIYEVCAESSWLEPSQTALMVMTRGHIQMKIANPACMVTSKCDSNTFPTIKSGLCPTYRPLAYNKKKEVISYFCDILIKQGATIDQDKYHRMVCESLTNKITCNGPRGRFEATLLPY